MKQLLFILLAVSSVSAKAFNPQNFEDSLPLLNRKAPAFSLKDIDGHVISLSSLKGKVVVLDFWATWCAPCHESFPAMQQSVDHFAQDTGVVFLFVDTREQAQDPVPLIKKDLQRNHYSFHVVLDEKAPDGAQKKMYNQYGMAGIPTKFIVDRNGVIRYKLEGYEGWLTAAQEAGQIARLIEKVRVL